MAVSQACCSIPPVVSDYQPTGSYGQIDDLPYYLVGPKDASKAVIVIYDIFGYHPNTKQFCDLLAKHCGYKVIMPDFFRGKPATPEMLGNRDVLLAWIGQVGTFEIVKPQIEKVRELLQGQGVTKAGLVGFCWGAKIAVQMASLNGFYAAASLVHPSFVDVKDAEQAAAPILAIPSKDEPDMTEYMEVLYKKPFGSKCKHQRFDDMHHGFAAARGDYKDELNKKRATEAIQLTANFFQEILNSPSL